LRADDFQFYSSGKLKQFKKQVFSLEENEKIIIHEAMRECNGNLSETADRLGITRATLYRKIKKYDL
jgi:transcriptional regulator of acetoin/glycerol metabolism